MTEITSVGDDFMQKETNLTWAEEENNVWKGWTYSPKKNRYYFDDVGNESLAAFWADEFLNQAYQQ
jgi:hypothetical protein